MVLRQQCGTRLSNNTVSSQPHPLSCRGKQLSFLLVTGNNSRSPELLHTANSPTWPDTEKAVYCSTHESSQFQPFTFYLFNPDQERTSVISGMLTAEPLASFCECSEWVRAAFPQDFHITVYCLHNVCGLDRCDRL